MYADTDRSIVMKIEQKMRETEDSFIVETVIPFVENILNVQISKSELLQAVENKITYCWHNLRVDPYDLPEHGKPVLCCALSFSGDYFYFVDESDEHALLRANVRFPIAWRYLELFKEV